MLKGDLSASSLAPVLIDLATSAATGSVILNRPDGAEAQLFLRSGMICGISAPDQRSDLGAKLVSSGVLAPEALSDALEAQRTDLSAWNLGELLVHLGYVEEDVIQEFVTEQLHEALWDLLQWNEGRWKFRKNAKIREDIRPPQPVVELLETLRERGYEWEEISSVVNSPDAIPVLSARGDGAPETTLDSDAWSMLCKIDGVRSVTELANDCGYTLFEAGQVLVTLVDAGLVDISDVDDDSADVYGASALAQALSGRSGGAASAADEPEPGDDALTRLARLASDVTSHQATAAATNPLQLDVMAAQLNGGTNLTVPVRRSGDTFAASMGRVSGALADALGPAPEDHDDAISLIEVRKRPKQVKEAATVDGEQELERRRRLRAAAAAELASAQADAEALRPDHDVNARADVLDVPPKLVDLDTERARVAAREAEEASRHASEDAARRAAEEFAKAATEQAARHAAERAEAQQTDTQLAEQQAAAAEQARREAAEQQAAAAEQARREAAEQAAEAARVAAEQAAAEEAARRLAEQQAAQEVADQAAAAQAAAEQAAQEAAAQEAAERAAAESRDAAARAEAESSLIAAQAQAAAADEAQRLAQEARRVADEQAALAADTAAKHAAIDEQDFAAAAALADQAAEASAMLAELHHSASADPEPVITVVADPEPEHHDEPDLGPVSMRPGGEAADTAALLRELSSLGLEDDDRPVMSNSAPRASRPSQVDPKKAKKKIGLFGL
ncbi:MAG TPA: DUF4388 domain-containing protein [Mycobacteriales bacterium]|nr:DUF4388 domain-containing protein [Mycobacteriales bacterium]